MRRVLLFAASLLLLGLTTATAASFDVQAEDITSFSQDVTIVTPPPPLEPIPFPVFVYVRGDSGVLPGQLELIEPAENDSVQKKLVIARSATPLFEQATTGSFFTWQTVSAPASGYLLTGDVELSISVFDGLGDKLTAGLLKCPGAAPPTSLAAAGCQLIDTAISGAATRTGLSDVLADFGPVTDTTIPDGWQLRLKVVNRTVDDGGLTISTKDWELQWGYLPSRQSLLEITP